MNRVFVNRAFGAIALAGLMTVGAAMASGPYDGQWTAHSSFAQRRCTSGDFPVTVANNKVTGTYTGVYGTYQLSGTIAADGTFSGNYGKGPLTGKFSGGKFDGTFPPSVEACGGGHMQIERAK